MNLVMVLAEELDPKKVSPGVPGFLWTFAVMLAFIVLIFSFLKHMRRLNVNVRKAELAQEEARRAAEVAQAGSPRSDGAGEPAAPDSVAADSAADDVGTGAADPTPGDAPAEASDAQAGRD